MRIATDLDGRLGPGVRVALRVACANVRVRREQVCPQNESETGAWSRELATRLGWSWPAITIARARRVGGLWTPETDVGSCNAWLRAAGRAGLVTDTAEPAAVVLYTDGERIVTGRYAGQPRVTGIGLVMRSKPVPVAAEGDVIRATYDVNEYRLMLRRIESDRVLCFIKPGAR